MISGPLYFIHVPKTAGSALREVLGNFFCGKKVFDSWNDHDVFEVNPEILQNAELIMAHAGLVYAPYTVNPEYVIVLRDPVELTLSYYEQIIKDKSNLLNSIASSMTVDEFFYDFEFIKKYANPYTRAMMTDSPENLMYQYYGAQSINYNRRAIDIEHWIEKGRVPYIRHVINSDELDSGIAEVAISHGFNPVKSQKTNVNPKKNYSDFYTEHVDNISKANSADYRLIHVLKEQRNNDERLGVLRFKSNTCYERGSILYPTSTILGDGWNSIEFYDSTSAVWSRSEAASIYISTADSVKKIVIRFSMLAPLGNEIYVEVNKIIVYPQIVIDYGSEEHNYLLVISLEGMQRNACGYEVLLKNLPLISPGQTNNVSFDDRTLGIYFKWLSLI